MAANGAKAKGPSVADITSRLATPKIVQREGGPGLISNGQPRPSDVVDQLRDIVESRTQQKIVDAQIASIEAETEAQKVETQARRVEAEVKLLESQSRLDALMRKGREEGTLSPEMQIILEMLQKQIEQSQGQSSNGVDPAVAQVLEAIVDQLSEMRKQVMELASGRTDEDSQKGLVDNIQQIVAIKALFEDLWPREKPEIISAASKDLETTLMMQKTQLEIERLRHQMRMDETRMQNEKELKEKELELQGQRNQSLKEGLENLFTNFAPLVKDLAANLQGRPGGVTVARVAEPVSGAVVTTPYASPPPSGLMQTPCINPQCRRLVSVAEGQVTATCEYCGLEQRVEWVEEEPTGVMG